jgi:hypothetical protein
MQCQIQRTRRRNIIPTTKTSQRRDPRAEHFTSNHSLNQSCFWYSRF